MRPKSSIGPSIEEEVIEGVLGEFIKTRLLGEYKGYTIEGTDPLSRGPRLMASVLSFKNEFVGGTSSTFGDGSNPLLRRAQSFPVLMNSIAAFFEASCTSLSEPSTSTYGAREWTGHGFTTRKGRLTSARIP